MKKNHFLIILLLFLGLKTLHAQTIDFNYNDGSNASYNVNDIRKITFVADVMNLHFNDGSIYSWNVSSIGYYTYNELPVNVDNYLRNFNALKMNIFPNPTNSFLNISFNLPYADNLSISISDMQGKIILEKKLGNVAAGIQVEIVDMSGLAASNYICKIEGSKGSFTKSIIKK